MFDDWFIKATLLILRVAYGLTVILGVFWIVGFILVPDLRDLSSSGILRSAIGCCVIRYMINVAKGEQA